MPWLLNTELRRHVATPECDRAVLLRLYLVTTSLERIKTPERRIPEGCNRYPVELLEPT